MSYSVLEIGCFSGYSALAWYEGTKDTKAEIVTLEYSRKMIAASREAFAKYGVEDRIKLVEGPAEKTLPTLTGEFDLIFVDANKDGYANYVKTILDQKLLSPNGIILCDNGTCPFFVPLTCPATSLLTNANNSLCSRPFDWPGLRPVAQRPRPPLLAQLRPGAG